MQIRTKLVLCVGTLAMVIVGFSGLMMWNTYRFAFNQQRTILAYSELTGYLQLSSEVYRTFKTVRRDLLNNEGALSFDLDATQSRLFSLVEKVEDVAEAEEVVGARGGEVMVDTARAGTLHEILSAAFADIREAERMISAGRKDDGRIFLNERVEARINQELAELVDAAEFDEREELREALEEIEKVNRIATYSVTLGSVIGLVLTGWVMYVLVIKLRENLRFLENGAALFAAGQLDHRIPVTGHDEFARLSDRFNSMAGQLLAQRKVIDDARISLEHRVTARTAELHAANTELQRRDETRRQFFADIGHELRTPITAVRGEAEVALRARQDREMSYKTSLERIIEIASQLTRLVDDIFLIAREQAGISDMRYAEIDLRDPVLAAVEQTRAICGEHRCQTILSLGEEAAPVSGDSQRLCQLLQILITNAIHHSPPETRIQFQLTQIDLEWLLRVEDNGPGIPEREAGLVFDRFYRGAAKNESALMKSSGLGLPIAKSIVNAHRGRISIDTTFSGGTAFMIYLPVLEEDFGSTSEPGMEWETEA